MSPGRENFKAHLQELKARTCPPIIGIEEGDGSAVIKFAHRRNGYMDIHFTFTNVDGYPYPQSSHVFLYMDAVDPNAQTASKILESYGGPCKPLISLVAQVVRDLCVHFKLPPLPPTFEQGCPTSIRAQEEGSDGGSLSEDGCDFDDEEIDSDDELWNEMFEESPGINEGAANTLHRDMCQLLTIYDVNDVRDEKGRPKKERKPRYVAGILSACRHGFFVWVTREFSSLGLDADVLEAWGIDVGTFPRLAIVFQFSPAYVERKDDQCGKKYPKVRIALSKKEKIGSFKEVSHLFSEHAESPDIESDNDVDRWVLTEPIQQALSRRMRHVVNLRAAHSLSFVQAEALFDMLTKDTDASSDEVRSPNLDEVNNIRETLDTEGYVRPRTRKAIEDARREENNYLFSAVEYVEYRIRNTTKYCIVCYENMDESIELLKPFVCNRPLCLFNFIDQGLGTDVEGEILRNGAVVDLLVSLAYVAACARALDPFPHGIVCKEQVPEVGTGKILKGSGRELHGCPKVDWFKESYVGRHIKITGTPGTYRIEQVMSKSLCLLSTPLSEKWDTGNGKEYTIMTTIEKTFETSTKAPDYDKVLQCMAAIPSIECMANILRRADIPPVKKATRVKMNASQSDRARLKRHFEKLPEGNLAYLLLRWIVCSNRAHFRELQGDEALQGVHPQYTQFAMVTGSPEKESNFKQALKTHAGNKQALYAFHGSPLQNWHSIIRHGLWYKTIAHGRSYGDGIYHALDSSTSLGYCRGMVNQQWPESALKPGLCISLNQIVNRPEGFTSANPYLVVQHTEWVQTRYLLVCSTSTGAPAASAIVRSANAAYLPLDTTYAPSMQGVRISIPQSIVSRPPCLSNRLRDYMGTREVTVVEVEVMRMISKLKPLSRRDYKLPAGWYKTTSLNKDARDKVDETLRDRQPKAGIGPFAIPGVEVETVPKPSYATATATRFLTRELRTFVKSMEGAGSQAGVWIDVEKAGENLFCWNVYVPRYIFTQTIPLVNDMKEKQLESIAFQVTFPPEYPSDPPFVRILHPRLLRFQDGGGGHVTAGGSMCMDLLTSSGWNSVVGRYAVEAVLLQVRLTLEKVEPFPARLDPQKWMVPYQWQEAASAYLRVARDHGWLVPDGFSAVNREMSAHK